MMHQAAAVFDLSLIASFIFLHSISIPSVTGTADTKLPVCRAIHCGSCLSAVCIRLSADTKKLSDAHIVSQITGIEKRILTLFLRKRSRKHMKIPCLLRSFFIRLFLSGTPATTVFPRSACSLIMFFCDPPVPLYYFSCDPPAS